MVVVVQLAEVGLVARGVYGREPFLASLILFLPLPFGGGLCLGYGNPGGLDGLPGSPAGRLSLGLGGSGVEPGGTRQGGAGLGYGAVQVV